MLNNGNKNDCGFADDIVAYIYDEIGSAERGKFEKHLAGCTACTDEFAGVSNARFSVFEWQREEFAHLETPEIVIPYAPRPRRAETTGFFAGFREMLTLSGWSSAVMVAGALIICIGLGFAAMNYVGSNRQIAENNKPVVDEQTSLPTVRQEPQNMTVAGIPQKAVIPNSSTVVSPAAKPTPSHEIRAERAAIQVRRVREKNLTASMQTVDPSVRQKRNAPALTPYDDVDDKSLRLADLFDEGGL